ncbi:1-deoxy-D-xylulose-5-phosphate synthase [Spirochaeta thermophila]|uniref:1-deoxy-D-xylulose-5-phosphate synthase n=1 Tax=Winmispira thermophila (strain ATCC 49972 / DSM 6192 / RI 19.B1) TaxID=665571 RepID=E0RPJ2_WINT6|nr:1-deoxy-D-xylulose-5-phosphate synthase [Spirochaeta thermophila]ADN02774.1 1-deoxy-D-xylulose-5-phosphate synthase [Spirochaeta thermophila DSM 6192]
MNFTYLSQVEGPEDVKRLSFSQLSELAEEIREYILATVSRTGGHLASNLGVIELTLALHYVFESPKDRIIWDVGHQCYPHKILTGRRDAFPTLRQRGGISGFPKPSESEHDVVETGHASTSLSIGLGLRMGMELLRQEGKVVAVIGDGALTGGMALEALNHAGHLKKDLIIVLNDNDMSISPNVGALSYYFSRLSSTSSYQHFREWVDGIIAGIPHYGGRLMDMVERLKAGVKSLVYEQNLFSVLGFEYVGPVDGHRIDRLVQVFQDVREMQRPVVVHVKTRKGKGYPYAEEDPTTYHGVSSFCVDSGEVSSSEKVTFTQAFSQALLCEASKDERITAITAAMETGTGLAPFRQAFPDRFYDVGIAEQHAVGLAAGLARAGLRPVVALYSTFLQRAIDQVIHDVAIPKLPVVFAIDRAGLVPGDGETHQGIFDVPMLKAVPGMTILMPATADEMHLMLRWALERGGPVALRYPKDVCLPPLSACEGELIPGRGVFLRETGEAHVLLVGAGGHLRELLSAAELLSGEGIPADVYHLRFLKPLDLVHLGKIFSRYRGVYLLEDGVASGGVGETILAAVDVEGVRLVHKGVPDEFPTHATRQELLADYGLDAAHIAELVREGVGGSRRLHSHSA